MGQPVEQGAVYHDQFGAEDRRFKSFNSRQDIPEVTSVDACS